MALQKPQNQSSMKRIIISGALIAVLLAFNCISLKADETIGEGNVSGLWTKANSTYQVNGNITIAAGDTLTIEPGVKVEFMGHFGIEVEGVLLAVGMAGDTIRFTKTDTLGLADYSSTDGAWWGINFSANSVGHMTYCVVEFINRYTGGFSETPVFVNNAELNLVNSVFRHNYGYNGALDYYKAKRGEVRDNLFVRNVGFYDAGALKIFENAPIVVEGNTFLQNKGNFGGAILVGYGGAENID